MFLLTDFPILHTEESCRYAQEHIDGFIVAVSENAQDTSPNGIITGPKT